MGKEFSTRAYGSGKESSTRAGTPIAQWVKRWPTDLAVPSSSPAQGEIVSTIIRGSIAQSLSLSSAHRPDMTEILLKRT